MTIAWEKRYLNYLGIAEATPDLSYLTLLTSTHLRRVPYETVSKFHFYMTELEHGWLVPPIEEFVSNLTRKGWGGNCYTITFECGEELIINQHSDQIFKIDRKRDGKSFVTKHIEWRPLEVTAFGEDILYSHRDQDDNPFMRRITIAHFKDGFSYFLRNEKLLIQSNDEKAEYVFTKQEEWLVMVTETFGIRREVLKEALDFLIKRDVLFLK